MFTYFTCEQHITVHFVSYIESGDERRDTFRSKQSKKKNVTKKHVCDTNAIKAIRCQICFMVALYTPSQYYFSTMRNIFLPLYLLPSNNSRTKDDISHLVSIYSGMGVLPKIYYRVPKCIFFSLNNHESPLGHILS